MEYKSKIKLYPSEITGFLLIGSASLLGFADIRLSTIPLSIFLILCLTAPFAYKYGFFVPVIAKGKTGKKAVSITFDDGPDPFITPLILNLLKKHRIKAVFFITGQKALRYPGLIKKIISSGHEIGNHSFIHDNFVMLKTRKNLEKEIDKAQAVFYDLGIKTFAFRPPVGITSPRLKGVPEKRKMFVLNFSCRAFDFGNRRIKRLSYEILKKVKPDDIILLHDVMPPCRHSGQYLICEIEKLILGLKKRDFEILPLSALIGQNIMATF